MRMGVLALSAVVAVVPAPVTFQAPETLEVERPFAKAGQLHLDLSAGDYTIRGAIENRILVRMEARDRADLARARADIAVNGSAGSVRVRGPKNNFRVQIDVPARTDLTLDVSAGDLKISGIEGNKTLDMWAGDVTIDVGDPAQYRRVDASVRFGEITSRPFSASKGGIFRSFSWDGSGQYTLRAKLFAGDLKLNR